MWVMTGSLDHPYFKHQGYSTWSHTSFWSWIWNSRENNMQHPNLYLSHKVSFRGGMKNQKEGTGGGKEKNPEKENIPQLGPPPERTEIQFILQMTQIMVGAGGGSYSGWRHRMLASSNFGETPLLSLFLITTPKMIPNTEVGHKVLLLNSSSRKSISQEFAHFLWLE